jgi:glycosidase
MADWVKEAIFYHIYPLGLCGAPARNDFQAPESPRLEQLYGWLDHIQNLGANALYLGPVFESSAHGYDTADYFRVDRRLGNYQTLAELSAELHRRGMRLVLDGVFNHVGRDFWAFKDVLAKGRDSAYCDWFYSLDFSGRSPYGDPFSYEGWSGHYDLVKLNLHNSAVRDHLFQAVAQWIAEYNIDGIRLDAADQLDLGFMKALAVFCRSRRPDFWLVGEVIHGDYRNWANPQTLDAVTNYECYKGLYSSHVDKNYFEIAYALNRQFGEGGIYRGLHLYNFADNHDVNRVATSLSNPAHLYPLYSLLFTMPGVPSLYYGSEWGIEGQRTNHSDSALRPQLDITTVAKDRPQAGLAGTIRRLAQIRQNSTALKCGDYRQLLVNHEQLAFSRTTPQESIVVIVNAAEQPVSLDLALPGHDGRQLVDLLNQGECYNITGGKAHIEIVWPHWSRIMLLK